MTDHHRRDLLPVFLPAVRSVVNPVVRDAYLMQVATLTALEVRFVAAAFREVAPSPMPGGELACLDDLLRAVRRRAPGDAP